MADKLLAMSSLFKQGDEGTAEMDVDVSKREESTADLDMFEERISTEVETEDIFSGGELKIKKLIREVEPSDDSEGYYCFRIGEVLKNRYQIIGYHGKGMFSNVLKATDLHCPEDQEVAIKLIRNNPHMKRTGKKEVKILQQLRETDPDGKYNNIRLLSHFIDRDHLCLVFEPMDLNLRQLLKKYGGNGLSIGAIRVYAFKLLKALVHLKRNDLIHADIKPDNILINKNRKVVKLADLGSAMSAEEAEPTPILVSRFYRAPEIIIGLNYGPSLDMFSFGCCLFELATGKPLLRSTDNNHHLKLLADLKGPVPKRLLQHAKFRVMHFDEQFRFLERVEDLSTKKEIVRVCHLKKPTRNLTKELLCTYPTANFVEKTQITQLADLIDKCTELDPTKRIDPAQALKHALFKN